MKYSLCFWKIFATLLLSSLGLNLSAQTVKELLGKGINQEKQVLVIPDSLFKDGQKQSKFISRIYLEEQFQLLEDSSAQWQIEDIIQPKFEDAFYPNVGIRNQLKLDRIYWAKLKIHNPASEKRSLLMVLGPRFDRIDAYLVKNQQVVDLKKTGQKILPNQKDQVYSMGGNAINIPLKSEDSLILYLRLDQTDRLGKGWEATPLLNALVYAGPSRLQNLHRNVTEDALYWGIFLALALYHLLLYFSTRMQEKAYLYYSLSIFFITFWIGSDRLLLYYIMPGFWGYSVVKNLAIVGTGYTTLWFTDVFLDLKRHLPMAHRIFKYGQHFFLGILFYVFLRDFWRPSFLLDFHPFISSLFDLYENVLLGLYLIALIAVSIILSYRRYLLAYFYLFSFALYILIILAIQILSIAWEWGWLTSDQNSLQSLSIGINLGANSLILLSFSLSIGYKINQLQKEKFLAIQRYNNELEVKVEERTEELQDKNVQLRKLNEDLLSLNEEKNNFVEIVAHDMGTNLAVINVYVGLLKMHIQQISDDQLEYLDTIAKTNQELSTMMRRILDIRNLEDDGLAIRLEEVDCFQIMEKTVRHFKGPAENKGIKIEENYLAKNGNILADATFLKQVLDNLLSNAIKFSPSNKSIWIKVEELPKYLQISIKDEGPGIKEEDRPKLFEKYQKLSARPTAGESSTGLGLSIVKKYTEAMHGKVQCESQMGQGANFILMFQKARKNETF